MGGQTLQTISDTLNTNMLKTLCNCRAMQLIPFIYERRLLNLLTTNHFYARVFCLFFAWTIGYWLRFKIFVNNLGWRVSPRIQKILLNVNSFANENTCGTGLKDVMHPRIIVCCKVWVKLSRLMWSLSLKLHKIFLCPIKTIAVWAMY